jgi:hypothetical protein
MHHHNLVSTVESISRPYHPTKLCCNNINTFYQRKMKVHTLQKVSLNPLVTKSSLNGLSKL